MGKWSGIMVLASFVAYADYSSSASLVSATGVGASVLLLLLACAAMTEPEPGRG
ncbi:MAG: hypothetical protein GXY83_18150 [Rhodopirellula sp.]|nr:hypothetical protein [Rhodopirellula sp.]